MKWFDKVHLLVSIKQPYTLTPNTLNGQPNESVVLTLSPIYKSIKIPVSTCQARREHKNDQECNLMKHPCQEPHLPGSVGLLFPYRDWSMVKQLANEFLVVSSFMDGNNGWPLVVPRPVFLKLKGCACKTPYHSCRGYQRVFYQDREQGLFPRFQLLNLIL